jgi:putative tryptophan/tyrosine transport system substrate-binding protein
VNRRELMLLLGGVVTAPLASRAQQKAMPVIRFLSAGSPGPSASNLAAFRQGLSETGYIETRNPASTLKPVPEKLEAAKLAHICACT